jgi:pimeloyl-ACP methyl ester carboxylesterase
MRTTRFTFGMITGQRVKVWFASGDANCAAWHYPGTNGACVVMSGGGGITKEPGTDRFAARFQAAGYSVLAFDYRHSGESGGEPRQVIRTRSQQADWSAALAQARTLPEVDPARIAAWSFSLSAGHLFRVAADQPVAAVIAQTPLVDGFASSPYALRHETLGVIMRMPFLALLDVVGGFLGRGPRLIPLAGPRGAVAMLTTPDAQDGDRALDPEGRYPEWSRTVSARSVLRLTWYRPGRAAARITCPLLVVVAEQDRAVLAAPAVRAAGRAPHAEVVRLPGTHYTAFLAEHEHAVTAELDFLARHLG